MKNRKTVLTLILTVVITVSAFSQQYDSERDFMVERRGNGVTIIDYLGTKNEVRIPTRIQNLPVTGIGENAFQEYDEITSITIPNSVTKIGDQAFSGCYGLTSIAIPNSITSIGDGVFDGCESLASVTIPDSVTSIGRHAFYDCTSLVSITIPDSVTSIGDYTFYGCESLTSIIIPASVTRIGGGAFSNCTSLTAINVAAGNNAFTSESGILYSKDKTSLRAYPAGKTDNSFTVPNSVTGIGWGAFQGSASLTNVTIPDSVTNIGNNAFSGCGKLTSVTFQGVINKDNFSDNRQEGRFTYYYNPFPGDLRAKFYATNAINGTAGTYTRSSGSNTWTKQ